MIELCLEIDDTKVKDILEGERKKEREKQKNTKDDSAETGRVHIVRNWSFVIGLDLSHG